MRVSSIASLRITFPRHGVLLLGDVTVLNACVLSLSAGMRRQRPDVAGVYSYLTQFGLGGLAAPAFMLLFNTNMEDHMSCLLWKHANSLHWRSTAMVSQTITARYVEGLYHQKSSQDEY